MFVCRVARGTAEARVGGSVLSLDSRQGLDGPAFTVRNL